MNSKNTWLLVLTAAALFAFIFFFERHLQEAAPVTVKILPSFKAAEVTSIQIQPLGQLEIRAERTNGGWQLTKPLVYPAQAIAIENLLRELEKLSPRTWISAQELKGRHKVNEEYGFDSPQVTIVLQQGEEPRQLKLGKFTAPGDEVYAQVVGIEGVNIIATDLFKYVPRRQNDWRDTSFVDLKDKSFDRLTVANGAKILELQRDATNQVWRMTKPDPARADNPKIDDLLLKLQTLHVHRFETDDPKADLEPFGLTSPELELTFDQGTNHLFSLQLGKSPTNDTNLVYARRNGQSAIVLVPRDQLAPWRADSLGFRDHHLVSLASGAPDIIEVTGHENFTLQRLTNEMWRVTKPMDFPADTNLMRSFLRGLTGMQVVPYNGQFTVKGVVAVSDLPKYGLAPPVQGYLLKQNLVSGPAGTTNPILAEVNFGAMEADKIIFARRADLPWESSVYAINVTDFQKLPVTGFDLRERQIWNFTENEVASITLRQNGKALQLTHRSPNHWLIASGSGVIDELKLEVGAQELGLLAADAWVERGDQNRARYGITENSLQISVELKRAGKPEPLMFELGGLSPRKLRYGVVRMEDGQNWIFELPQIVMDRLTNYFNLRENAVP